ncbi:hypothetical protein D9M71_570860 [compost metagenome]
MSVQGLDRVFAGQQCGRLAWAVFTDDTDHDVAQLHLARLDPRPCLLPEHVAVRAVRVAEQVDDAWRVGLAVGNPGGLFHLRPDLLGHRGVDQFLQGRFAQVLALFIEQAADQYVLAIGRQVKGHAAALVFTGITAQPIGRVEAAFDFYPLGFHLLDRLGQVLGDDRLAGQQAGGEREGQFQQSVHVSFLEVSETAGAAGRSKDSRAWLRLARDSSPRWLPTRRPSAS